MRNVIRELKARLCLARHDWQLVPIIRGSFARREFLMHSRKNEGKSTNMKSLIMTKKVFLSLAALFVFVAASSTARADEVFVAGSTAGCFGAGCSSAFGDITGHLAFVGSNFSGTTANGFRGLGADSNLVTGNVNNLGSFSLLSNPDSYNTPFTLVVTFTAPQGITGSNQGIFSATVTGTVISNDIGGVFVDFDNTPLFFSFNDSNCEPDPTGGIPGQQTTCGSGSFSFSVNDVSIDPQMNVPITGQIFGAHQTAPVPEPASLFLLGSGIVGITATLRRRRKKSTVNSDDSGTLQA